MSEIDGPLSDEQLRTFQKPEITDKGLIRHVGDKEFRADIRSRFRNGSRVRQVFGTLVENDKPTYTGQQRFMVVNPNGANANLYPDRTTIGFRRQGDGPFLFYDYVSL